MATINQLKKQIETANKRANEYEAKRAMYEGRMMKAIENASKKTNGKIDIDNYREMLAQSNFELYFAIENNKERRDENIKKYLKELKNVEDLTTHLNKMQAKEEDITELEKTLEAATTEFKKAWFESMNEWYGRHYDNMRNRLQKANEVLKNKKEFSKYDLRNASSIVNDEANRMEKSQYMTKRNQELKGSWKKCLLKLAEKCRRFKLNETKLHAYRLRVTAKGFETLLSDGGERVIHARIIWAAEFSDIVTPHMRYIVTERKTKI